MPLLPYYPITGAVVLAALPLLGYGQITATQSPAQAGIATALASPPDARQRYPGFRMLTVQYDVLTPRRVELTHEDAPFVQTRSQATHQLRVAGTVPLLISKPLILMTNFAYLREQSEYRDVEATGSGATFANRQFTQQDFNLALMATHSDSLFHRPVTYLASLTGSSRNVKSLEKLAGYASVIFTLKSTPTTKLTAGVLVLVNPSSTVPAVPLVSYWHRLARSQWEVDALLPVRLLLRRPLPLASKGWLSVGTQIATAHFFGSTTTYQPQGKTYEWATNGLQTGALVEYPLHKLLMLGIRGGLNSQISSRFSPKNTTDYLVQAEARQSLYLGVNLSFVPR